MPTMTFKAGSIGREAGYSFITPETFDLLPGTAQYTNEQVKVVMDLLPDLVEQKIILIEDYQKPTVITEQINQKSVSDTPEIKASATKVAKSV